MWWTVHFRPREFCRLDMCSGVCCTPRRSWCTSWLLICHRVLRPLLENSDSTDDANWQCWQNLCNEQPFRFENYRTARLRRHLADPLSTCQQQSIVPTFIPEEDWSSKRWNSGGVPECVVIFLFNSSTYCVNSPSRHTVDVIGICTLCILTLR